MVGLMKEISIIHFMSEWVHSFPVGERWYINNRQRRDLNET
jgi:hypothetical protein